MAVFNLDYYNGEDLYSDGNVENEILKIVKENQDIHDIEDELSFPILYHLSPMRENILNWYSFKENADVLEIGAGCGAITGILCNKCSNVTSVELSKRRAAINYERHKKYDNLTIYVGNLNDINFDKKFDYVILNGVFEYAGSFTEGDNPYVDFLKNTVAYMKPTGKMLIAIENRLGLKYFAGSSEDHTNIHFLGLNNYQGVSTVRTFSKTEMKDVCCEAGLQKVKFFYPYPDYKFPQEIFTDDTINTMEYGRSCKQYEKDRVNFFKQEHVFSILRKEKIADKFANSFLVEATIESESENKDENQILYAKINSERAPKFQIGTRIIANKRGERKVEKYPLTVESTSHILNIKTSSNIAYGKVNYLADETENLELCQYSYLKEKNMNSVICEALDNRDIEGTEQLLKEIYSNIFPATQESNSFYSDKFIELFGSEKTDRTYKCVNPANVDLILDNIYKLNDRYVIIDCEWVFPIPVPTEFIIWRAINELYNKHPEYYAVLDRRIMQTWFNISSEDENVFLAWAKHFAYKYVGSGFLEKFAQPEIPFSLDTIIQELEEKRYLHSKLYIDRGKGFNEADVITTETKIGTDGQFTITYDLNKYNDIQSIRWDPTERVCECETCFIVDDEITEYTYHNGCKKQKDYFYTDDPWYVLNIDHANKIMVIGNIKFLTAHDLENEISEQKKNIEQKDSENERLRKEINVVVEEEKSCKEVLNQIKEEMQTMKSDLDYYQHTLDEIQSSVIWKGTNWIRMLSGKHEEIHNEPVINIDICRYLDNHLSVQGWMVPDETITSFSVVYKKGDYIKKLNTVTNIKREDVAEAFKDDSLLYCGFVAEWEVRNLKKGQIFIQYTRNNEKETKEIGTCGLSFFSEGKFYLDEMKKNGIKPYLFYLKPSNFKEFLRLRKLPNVIYDTSVQTVYPDLYSYEKDIMIQAGDKYTYKTDETISIIIPIYNGLHYLEKLFKEIYRTKVPFQLILINDKSPDERISPYLHDFSSLHPEVILLENEENLGFLKSVNRGLEVAEGHVAIVNTDIELPENWLERLMQPIFDDVKIASTTPFTNSGTICSFPDFCSDNKLFGNLNVEQIDTTFAKLKPIQYDMPTGVGFCMGMNKCALKDIGYLDEENFGKGYAEENDWCQRAIKAGYRNVHICNLFVFHNHGGSFPSEEKKRLLEDHRLKLLAKHPSYEIDVATYCSEDPAREIREFALFDLSLKLNCKKTLYFNHALGGGANDYLEKKKEEKCANGEVVLIVVYNYLHNVYNISLFYNKYKVRYSVSDTHALWEILNQYCMDEVVINNLVTYPNLYEILEQILQYKKKTNARLIMLIHDYFSICPTINLLNGEKKYCNVENCDTCKLEKCVNNYPAYQNMGFWKKNWKQFLVGCDEIVCFSHDSEHILQKQYGEGLSTVYIPHSVLYMPKLQKTHKILPTLNIGILGVLSEHKGASIVREMLDYIEKEHLDINIVLIGYLDEQVKIENKRFIVTGKYSVGELPKKIYQYDIDIFLIPSIWPETFSYTTQEIMEMNIPVAVFNIGAPAERVKDYDKGLILSSISGESAVKEIVDYQKKNKLPVVHNDKILFVAEYISFSSRYRVEHLAEQLLYRGIQSDFIEVKDVDIDTIDQYNRLIIYRCRKNEKLDQIIQVFHHAGKKVLYDIDDYIFNYEAIKEFDFLKDAEYKDFDKYSAKIRSCMDEVDSFITSTNCMKKGIQECYPNKPVIVNRNIASAEMLVESLKVIGKKKDKEKVILGYFSGSKTHDADFQLISHVIRNLMQKYDNLYLKIGGVLNLDNNFNEFSSRIIRFDFVDWKKLPALIQTVDINLMPLEYSFFHSCKSENKWMEAALVKVPTIMSWNEELEQCVADGKNAIICHDENEWENKLRDLIESEKLRNDIAQEAFEYCINNKTTLCAPLDDLIWRE